MLQALYRLIANHRGNTAIIFGLALPVMMALGAGAIDYASWLSTRAGMQSAADVAALAGAKELRLASADPAAVIAVATAQAQANLGASASSATIKAEVLNNKTAVKVAIDLTVSSWFGALAPASLGHLHAEATARTSASAPTCLLSLDQAALIGVGVNAATINSPGCAAYSNSKSPTGLTVLAGTINAFQTCSSGGYVGVSISVSPPALTDCPVMGDPLGSRSPPSVSSCDYTAKSVAGGTETLYPGTYCGGLTVTGGGTAVLTKGVYIIKDGPLTVNLNGTLKGDQVSFYLSGAAAVLDFDFLSTITLTCPSDGPLAGILFFEDRGAPVGRTHLLSSRNAPILLGTLYFPNGNLIVGALSLPGTIQAVCQNIPPILGQCPPILANIAIDSAWTIVIAHQIIVNFGVNLTLNTNYFGTSIPPPGEMHVSGASISQ